MRKKRNPLVLVTISDPDSAEVIERFAVSTSQDMSTYKLASQIWELVSRKFEASVTVSRQGGKL